MKLEPPPRFDKAYDDFVTRHSEGGRMLLTDEQIMDVVLDEGLGVVANDDTRAIAKAQLKKVVEELETQIGLYSRTADDGRVWLPIDEFRQSLLGEVSEALE